MDCGLRLGDCVCKHLTLWPITEAILFCLANQKHLKESPLLQSVIASAPDILDYAIQRLKDKLHTKITQIWTTDLETSIGRQSYLVGVNREGYICYDMSTNSAASAQTEQNPLAQLATDFSSFTPESEKLPELAKFQVVFTPPADVQIFSWRGIPLAWLGAIAYAGVLVISFVTYSFLR